MSKLAVPQGYTSLLTPYKTQTAIDMLRREFENNLRTELNLKRVSAPLFVASGTGINDDLNGTERAVEFDIMETGSYAQVVHSLAKWKRIALSKYGFEPFQGLYTDMNAIRRDEEMDNLHSIYVDQWDWEIIIDQERRNIDFLKHIVFKIVDAICDTEEKVCREYPELTPSLKREVSFITTGELEDLYPTLTPKERENSYLREHKTAFIMQIGDLLKSGTKHDGRAPDYDDWALNGDIVFWSELLQCAFEVSSMGIRVDGKSLTEQLEKAGCTNRRELPFHKALLEGKLPLTLGGGIGQSRLCMLLLKKAHIGEVQASIWDSDTMEGCRAVGIELL